MNFREVSNWLVILEWYADAALFPGSLQEGSVKKNIDETRVNIKFYDYNKALDRYTATQHILGCIVVIQWFWEHMGEFAMGVFLWLSWHFF
jgi:hypothetical protein